MFNFTLLWLYGREWIILLNLSGISLKITFHSQRFQLKAPKTLLFWLREDNCKIHLYNSLDISTFLLLHTSLRKLAPMNTLLHNSAILLLFSTFHHQSWIYITATLDFVEKVSIVWRTAFFSRARVRGDLSFIKENPLSPRLPSQWKVRKAGSHSLQNVVFPTAGIISLIRYKTQFPLLERMDILR